MCGGIALSPSERSLGALAPNAATAPEGSGCIPSGGLVRSDRAGIATFISGSAAPLRSLHAMEAVARPSVDKRPRGLIPNRLIMEISVVRFNPSRAAAPFGPPTTPSVWSRV